MPPKKGGSAKKKKMIVTDNDQINAVAKKVNDDVNHLIEESKNDSDITKVTNDVK